MSRNTGSGLAGTGSENHRREQHIKQQGPVFLVRVRARYWLEAEPYVRRLIGPVTRGKTQYSDPFTGDVYLELFQAEADELRARLAKSPEPADRAGRGWAGLDGAPSFDLAALMAGAAYEPGITTARLHQVVARRVRAGTDGRPDAVVLRLDRAALNRQTHRAVLRWAVDTLSADLADARSAHPDVDEPKSLAHYRTLLAAGPTTDPGSTTDRATVADAGTVAGSGTVADPVVAGATAAAIDEAAVHEVVREVNRVHDELTVGPDNAVIGPLPLPPVVSFAALSVEHLARDIAHELDAYIRVDITEPDGTVHSDWVQPSGLMHASDPLAPPAETDLPTARQTEVAGQPASEQLEQPEQHVAVALRERTAHASTGPSGPGTPPRPMRWRTWSGC